MAKNDSSVVSDESAENKVKYTESQISNLSFKHWHKLLQTEHEILEKTGEASPFMLWKWCHKGCLPCRWFDSIGYNKKISKCCLTFKTFKNIGTIIMLAVFFYGLMYSILKDEVLPGGSVFFLFFLFVTAYLVGYIVTLVGLPAMIGHLITGITFGNVPYHWLPDRDEEFVEKICKIAEKIFLVMALIRAGLLLDLSRMKNRFRFIIYVALFPFFSEFLTVWIASHFLFHLEWDWSALQGSTISIVSMATVTSIMEKNKKIGYGEDKHLSTVLIAAAVMNVILGLILYYICITYIVQGLLPGSTPLVHWKVTLLIIKESSIGMSIGLISGLLVSFFPDKRNSEAAGLRIIMIGAASFGITSFLSVMDMNVAAAIACVLMCFICTNMWEELGWHQDSNPVLYFYTMAYYIAQPMVLSLLAYTIKLKDSSARDIGLSFAVLLLGLVAREVVCILVLREKTYPTTLKEKLFICIAWLSKGTFQALLAFSVLTIIEKENNFESPSSEMLTDRNEYIRRTTILAILLLTPLVCYGLTLLTPKLLTVPDTFLEPRELTQKGRRKSIARYQDTYGPPRKFSVKYTGVNGKKNNETETSPSTKEKKKSASEKLSKTEPEKSSKSVDETGGSEPLPKKE